MSDRARRNNNHRTRRNPTPLLSTSAVQATSSSNHNNYRHHHHHGNHSNHHNHGHRSSRHHTAAASSNQSGDAIGLRSHHQLHSHHHSHHNHHHHHHINPSTSSNLAGSSSRSSREASFGHSKSICYSYLIAMLCSFLVALGIYLSLTRFNLKYLYISLIGLLIEAVGACIYCICNIRSSQLARQKPRLATEEFILDTSGNIRTNNTTNGNNVITIPTSNNHQTQRQLTTTTTAGQSPTITHILSNRTFNSNSNNDENIGTTSVDSITAININNDSQTPEQQQQSTRPKNSTEDGGENVNSLPPSTSNSGDQTPANLNHSSENSIIIIPDEGHEDRIDSLLTATSASLTIPVDQLPTSTTADTALTHDPSTENTDGNVQTATEADANQIVAPSQMSINLSSQFTGQLQDGKSSKNKQPNSPSTVSSGIASPESSQQQEISLSTSSAGPQPVSENDSTAAATASSSNQSGELSQQQQAAQERRRNRRTLIMGLSGEEEAIEIDEDDLDNMSILPPPYESIALAESTIGCPHPVTPQLALIATSPSTSIEPSAPSEILVVGSPSSSHEEMTLGTPRSVTLSTSTGNNEQATN